MKYKASYINGEDDEQTLCQGCTLEQAIDSCCDYAEDDWDIANEDEMCREALRTRGYYCVGYSCLSLFVTPEE